METCNLNHTGTSTRVRKRQRRETIYSFIFVLNNGVQLWFSPCTNGSLVNPVNILVKAIKTQSLKKGQGTECESPVH